MLTAVLILSLLGLISAVGLGVASRVFYVEIDPLVEKLSEVLPGANCGGCGFAGCAGFAAALAAKKVDINDCSAADSDAKQTLAKLLGVELTESAKEVAVVHCKFDPSKMQNRFEYKGVPSCKAANMLGGQLDCSYGCLGFGDCVKACNFNAIVIKDGLAEVIPEKCTSCGMCVEACPRNLIQIHSVDQKVLILCSNNDKAKSVSSVCKVGCITCNKCIKACPVEAKIMINQLAVIDDVKCIYCGACERVCPTNCMFDFGETHYIAQINDKCTGCTLCALKCPAGAISGDKKQMHVVDPKKCVRCRICYDICNFESIELVNEEGKIMIPPRPKKKRKKKKDSGEAA
jgi:H+/Na+-translocating ferredoxin:NAD+ oxidoreductase subunit B